MNWRKLEKLIPVAAGIASPALEQAANVILSEVDSHLQQQAAATGQTMEEIAAQASASWENDISMADALLKEK